MEKIFNWFTLVITRRHTFYLKAFMINIHFIGKYAIQILTGNAVEGVVFKCG
jgi:hypothetical protein